MSETLTLTDSCAVRYQSLGESVCQALQKEISSLGFKESEIPNISWQALEFKVVKDPADGSECLSGSWLNKHGHRIGCFQLNGNGSFFSEYDVVMNHPTDKRWFVEAVTAWGKDSKIITEPRLIALP